MDIVRILHDNPNMAIREDFCEIKLYLLTRCAPVRTDIIKASYAESFFLLFFLSTVSITFYYRTIGLVKKEAILSDFFLTEPYTVVAHCVLLSSYSIVNFVVLVAAALTKW